MSWVGGASRKAHPRPVEHRIAPARRGCPDPPWRETREQAYVPAEQPPPSQGARVPSAHAHPRRSRDPVLAPPQGPQEPRRLTAGSGRPQVRARAVRGSPAHRRRFLPDGSPRPDVAPVVAPSSCTSRWPTDGRRARPRVGFVVSKAVGNAVTRNRVKRRLRHLAREHVIVAPGRCCARGPGAARRPARRRTRNSVPTSTVAYARVRSEVSAMKYDPLRLPADRVPARLPAADQPALRPGLPLPPVLLGVRPGRGDRAR